MRNPLKFLTVVIRVANSIGIDHAMTCIGQDGKVDLSLAIGGNLFGKLLAFGRTINADCVDANLRFTRCE